MQADLQTVGPFEIGGASVFVDSNDPMFVRALEWSFMDLLAPESRETSSRDIIRFAAIRHAEPIVYWEIWRDSEACELALEEGYVLFHLQWEFNRVVLERLDHTIHAAAVELDGQGIIMCGSSMSGKTTLAAWLAAEGARFVADEVVVLRDDGSISPYPRPVGLRNDTPLATRFKHPDDFDRRFDTYEMLVPASALGARVAVDPVPSVRAIVFPVFDRSAPPSVGTIDDLTALRLLVENSPGVARHGRRTFERLAALVRGCISLRLSTNDLSATQRLLEDAIKIEKVA